MQRTIRHAACVLTMVAACLSAAAQTSADVTPKPEAAPSTQQPLAQQIAALLADPAVARAHWGVMVTALDGKPIYALNEGQLFRPDSNAKLFTTAAAMALLGADHRFTTQVVASGNLDKQGVLHGDLMLVGGGDANFGADTLPYVAPSLRPQNPPPALSNIADIDQLADQVVAAGLHEVQGNVIGDDHIFSWEGYPGSWETGDLLWGYGAPVSALAIHNNEIDVTVAPNPESHPTRSLPAEIQTTPNVPYYTIENHVYTMAMGSGGCDARLLFRRDPGSKTLEVSGDIVERVDPVFFSDPMTAAMKALGMT